ncbi:response regulator receiver modulated CheW protein [Desulfarculus baarsii DSM 2075]|uniref:Chemotaxis protein CheW n=1 Tax=Desulfarculus baarsii (strain ATCC 33931 / DSM 2075 / LMG 7858 / VKM B-1802 / 2st14) TaxID=644282 RepID=E1QER3_DESB2|nr:chemotaxis protein CheW [Desulfarculus baarsii]ADK84049.1 response regulator receiver modulated CheW protein [Desulfarculus baarsii DSM 2075]
MSVPSDIRILLVEDSSIMRKMELAILRELGFVNVSEADDGRAAVEKLVTEEPVELIISDWNMPNFDGYELLKWVRADARRKNTPFIMATAQGEKKQVSLAREAGVSALVAKPFNADELRAKIEQCFGQAEAADEGSKARQPQFTDDGRLKLKIAHIQITDHLILGVLKHQIETGLARPKHFVLETVCLPGWNPVQQKLENGELDGALVLAPIGMDLFGYGVPIKLCLLAHKNGSIFVRRKSREYRKDRPADYFRDTAFYIPHRLSVHHMISHMYLSQLGLAPGTPGESVSDVRFEVVPPIKMPELLAQSELCSGFMVAEPLGTKAIASGAAELHFLSGEVWEHHPCCVVTLRDEVIAAHEAAVQEFISLLVKAGQFVKTEPGAAADIAVNFLDPGKTLGLKKAVLQNVLTEPSGITTTDLFPVIDDLRRMQDYMVHKMGVGAAVDLDAFVETRFAEVACQGLPRELSSHAPGEDLDLVAKVEAARAAAGQSSKAMLTSEGKYLSFALGGEDWAMAVLKTREIVGMQPVTKVARMPEYIRGVINLRGRVIPLVDLRLKLGMDQRAYDERTCVIVVEVMGRKGVVQTGVVVDSVTEVLNIRQDQIMEAPNFGAQLDTRHIQGLVQVGGRVKILLNIDRLLSDQDMNMLEAV